jgi:predicted dehydrogenase
MQKKTFKVGIIGFGFIGKVHALGYWSIPYVYDNPPVQAQVTALLRTSTGRDTELIEQLGSPLVTDSMEEFTAQDLDLVDICTPNSLHLEEVQAVIKKKPHLYCEKPLGIDLAQARKIQKMAEEAGVFTHTALMMRYYPAVRQAKAALASGALGEIYHFRAQYFHSSYMDPNRPTSWRLQQKMSGGGAMADLGIHGIDMIRYLLGDAAWVQGRFRTLIKKRPITKGSLETVPVDVDDWGICLIGMKNGSIGSLESSRMGGGASEEPRLEIFGSKGSLIIDLHDSMHVQYYNQKKNQVQTGGFDFPTPDGERPIAEIWPPGKKSNGPFKDAHTAGIYDFLLNINEKKNSPVNFKVAVQAQEILEAAYLSSARDGQAVFLPLP